jgi:hypothetical protein
MPRHADASIWGLWRCLSSVEPNLWGELPDGAGSEPALATHPYPAFAVSQFDSKVKTKAYEIFRPEGGRKDILRWAAQGEKPVAELEIYRLGDYASESVPDIADVAARMDPRGWRELETAGIIDSKFGPVTLLRRAGEANDTASCLGFIKRLDEPKAARRALKRPPRGL